MTNERHTESQNKQTMARSIKAAKKSKAAWPKWMSEAAYFSYARKK